MRPVEHRAAKWAAALVLAGSLLGVPALRPAQEQQPPERFLAVDVFVDSGKSPLAAWQADLLEPHGRALVVGVEGGEHSAFQEAPYYDPAALRRGRIVLGAFHTGAELPSGRTRVARVHFLVTAADPSFLLTPIAAATRGGKPIHVEMELVK